MKTILKFYFAVCCLTATAQNVLFIPDTLTGLNYNLNMHEDSVQFFSGDITHTFAFNNNKYLGPTLIFNQGSNINITVSNQIGDTTTVHWHGVHVPSRWDGGPHTYILNNTSWNPQFTVMDNAATYWYHPHLHKKTAEQAIRGAAGLIIVRDSLEAALTLPRKYGIDDFPVIVQCQQYDAQNQAMPKGMQDSTLLVNGTMNPYLDIPAQVVRMRLLNASGERVFNFGFSGNKQFYQIASDGGLLNAPVQVTRVRLAPGERAEILLDMNGMNGQSFYMLSYASELPMGVQGGPTMPMPPPNPPMDSPLNGVNFNIMKINVTAQIPGAVTTIPSTLTVNIPFQISQSNTARTIRFTADNMMVMDGPFYFNDSTYNMMRVDYVVPLNSIETWKLVNETMVAHPFHIHDVQFFIIDRNGTAPGPEESGRKDVVLVPPGDSITFITKFTDFADTAVPYMFHCHVLMHEDDGMMGQFIVSPNSVGIQKNFKNKDRLILFPNPAAEHIAVIINGLSFFQPVQLNVYDYSGRKIYSEKLQKPEVNLSVSQWANGLYTIVVSQYDKTIFGKVIIDK